MIQLSFIIPAYNASSTIIRTLDSITSIILLPRDFEIIVVDDCSKDNTCEIIKKYQKYHSQVKLFCQYQNHRQGAARNRGLKEAKGQYVMFVDADDMVESGVIEAISQIQRYKLDVLFCNYLWVYSSDHVEQRSLPINDGIITSGKDFAEKYYDTITCTCPIAYLWRRDFLLNNETPFVEDCQMEDFDWIERNMYQANSIAYSKAVIYRVLTSENLNSTTHICSPETSADWARVSFRRMLFCDMIRDESPNFTRKIEFQSRCFVSNILKIRNITKFSPRNLIRLYHRIGSDAIQYFIEMGKWKAETSLCLRFPKTIVLLDGLMYPIAYIGRMIVRAIRVRRKNRNIKNIACFFSS